MVEKCIIKLTHKLHQFVLLFPGVAIVIWFIVWITFVYDEPEKDKFISDEEKRFIVENIQELPKKVC